MLGGMELDLREGEGLVVVEDRNGDWLQAADLLHLELASRLTRCTLISRSETDLIVVIV